MQNKSTVCLLSSGHLFGFGCIQKPPNHTVSLYKWSTAGAANWPGNDTRNVAICAAQSFWPLPRDVQPKHVPSLRPTSSVDPLRCWENPWHSQMLPWCYNVTLQLTSQICEIPPRFCEVSKHFHFQPGDATSHSWGQGQKESSAQSMTCGISVNWTRAKKHKVSL